VADPPADAQPLRTPPQRLPLQQTTERIAVALRVGNVVVGVPTALLAAVPPVSVRWVVGGLVVLAAWTVVFSLLAMTRGLVAPLMLVDAAVAVGFCLFIGRFVPVGRIDEGSSWIAVIGSICIVSLPFAFSARLAVPAARRRRVRRRLPAGRPAGARPGPHRRPAHPAGDLGRRHGDPAAGRHGGRYGARRGDVRAGSGRCRSRPSGR